MTWWFSDRLTSTRSRAFRHHSRALAELGWTGRGRISSPQPGGGFQRWGPLPGLFGLLTMKELSDMAQGDVQRLVAPDPAGVGPGEPGHQARADLLPELARRRARVADSTRPGPIVPTSQRWRGACGRKPRSTSVGPSVAFAAAGGPEAGGETKLKKVLTKRATGLSTHT